MIAALLLSVLSVSPSPSFPRVVFFQEATDPETDAKIAEAGKDVAKLMELGASLKTAGKDDAAKKVFKKVVEIDPNHEAAHKELRHHFYDNKWFESYAELSKYRREETAKMKEKGLVRFKDQWVPEVDLPYMNMGWTKDDKGQWQNPVEVEEAKQLAEFKAKNFTFRADDNSWVSPEDMAQWNNQLWKCGDQWLDLAKANEFHANIATPWQLEGEHFVVSTTCDWEGGNWARWYADQCYGDLKRVFGLEPAKKPSFVVLNSLDQTPYNFNKWQTYGATYALAVSYLFD